MIGFVYWLISKNLNFPDGKVKFQTFTYNKIEYPSICMVYKTISTSAVAKVLAFLSSEIKVIERAHSFLIERD